jgi:hypothetical protein
VFVPPSCLDIGGGDASAGAAGDSSNSDAEARVVAGIGNDGAVLAESMVGVRLAHGFFPCCFEPVRTARVVAGIGNDGDNDDAVGEGADDDGRGDAAIGGGADRMRALLLPLLSRDADFEEEYVEGCVTGAGAAVAVADVAAVRGVCVAGAAGSD